MGGGVGGWGGGGEGRYVLTKEGKLEGSREAVINSSL